MSTDLSANIRLGLFERPSADFTLRRFLEIATDRARATEVMSTFSRFVVLVPFPECPYVRCANLEEVWRVIETARDALTKQGVRHIYVDTAVDPSSRQQVNDGLDRMEKSVRPAAANDPD